MSPQAGDLLGRPGGRYESFPTLHIVPSHLHSRTRHPDDMILHLHNSLKTLIVRHYEFQNRARLQNKFVLYSLLLDAR